MLNDNIGENIKALRKASGLSQEALAGQLHVVRQTVSKWEKGLSVPDGEMLVRIAEALGTTANALLGLPEESDGQRDAIRALADRLDALDQRLAAREERRRRILRVLLMLVCTAAVIALLWQTVSAIHLRRAGEAMEESVSIIGGADGPTAIFVTGGPGDPLAFIVPVLLAAACALGLYHTRRR